jgi:hypothetical protein
MGKKTRRRSAAEEQREPVIRPRSTQEELAGLHPIERFLFRCFEFLSSLKLAVVLMAWLMIELAIGTQIESTLDASAAKYFVYSSVRFYLLLSLLALNILCAALIRIHPWKNYRIGFFVTHAGLLVMLFGSMVTAISNVDALLIVPKDKISDRMVHPDRQVLHFSLRDATTGKTLRQSVPVEFGPLTWGSNVLGIIPWGKNHVEEFALDRLGAGTKARVTRFIANADAREAYEAQENGVPAVEFTLSAPDFRYMSSTWLAGPTAEERSMGAQELRVGGVPVRARIWRLESQDELDHFVHAAPQGAIEDPVGVVGVSVGGRHATLPVGELQAGPVEIAGAGARVELLEYMRNAVPDPETRSLKNEGDVVRNPAVKLRITRGGQTGELYALADFPEFAAQLGRSANLGKDVFATFFKADQPTELQMGVTLGEQLGYRAFSSRGCTASVVAALGETYPAFGMFEFTPERVLASASPRPTMELIPLPAPSGRPPLPGIEIEVLFPDGAKVSEKVIRGVLPAERAVGRRLLRIDYDVDSTELPFAIRLDDFNEPKQPGTMDAAKYESFVTVLEKAEIPAESFDPKNPLHQSSGGKTYAYREALKAEVKMNHPLYYRGGDGKEYTLFQSGIDRSSGVPVSTFTVSYDPGLPFKYAGLVVLCVGIFLMFYMGGYFRKRTPGARTRRQEAASAPSREETPDDAAAVGV